MALGAVPETGASPRRGRQLIPAGLPRRGEVLGVFAVTIVAGHLVFAPVTLVVAVVLTVVGKASRWRLWWLLVPVAAGLAWTLALGPGTALAHFTAWPSGILGSLHGHLAGHPAAEPGHPAAGLRVAWSSLPGQLPVALICGAAEAAVLGWLVWLCTDEWAVPASRPGAFAGLRGRFTAATIRAGAVLTRDGCALGVMPATGAVAELTWAEMSGGLLITGDDPRDVTLASLQLVHAALRRRKPLLVFDQGEGNPIDRALTAACRATGTPLRTDGSAADTRAARVAGDAEGSGGAGAADGAQTPGRTGGASASLLWGRARAEPPDSPHAASTGAAAAAPRGGGTAVGTAVDPHQVMMERSAAWLPADSPEAATRACADLAALAQHLRAIGVDGDGLVWIPRGELVPAEDLAALLRDASATGLHVLIGATSPAEAADLARLAGATFTLRVTDPALAAHLAELTGTRMLPAPVAAELGGVPGAEAGSWPLPGIPALPPFPALSSTAGPIAMAVPAAMAMPTAASTRPAASGLHGTPALPGMPVMPGIPAMPGTDLVRYPVIAPRTLQALRRGEFVLTVNTPQRRLIAHGRLVPARLPQWQTPPRRTATGVDGR